MKTISEKELENGKELPGDGWFIIEAAGQHPAVSQKGFEFTQNLTPAVLARIAAAGVPEEGLFVDVEHESLEGGSSAARGWVKELAMCNGNLAARIEWTAEGLPLIQGKVYKHFSTVYHLPLIEQDGAVVEPQRLNGLTLTNLPNNERGQEPITNRKKTSPCTQGNNQTKTNNTMNPELLQAMGLPENATEEEAIARAQGMAQELADLRAAADKAADAEADALINSEAAQAGVELTEEEKKEVKDEIVSNRKHGLRFLEVLCNSKKKTAAPAANTRRYPGKPAEEVLKNRKPAESRAQRIVARANEICANSKQQGKKMGFWEAKAIAERELKD